MTEIKIATGKNAVLLEKELNGLFTIGFAPVGNLVHNPADGLVQMVARESEPLKPENKQEPETPQMEKV